jgi:predicted transposase/invertase (TIGR01784 family)
MEKRVKKTKDTIFKHIFEDKEIFLMFIKDFIDREWVREISVSDLTLMPSKYIGLRSGNLESDIVYKLKLKEKDAYIFIHLEHQGKVNHLMSFRFLEYMTRIWKRYIFENKKSSNGKEFKLPPIVPVLFYDGIEKWSADKEFSKKIENNELFKKYIPKYEYEIINLNNISFEKLEELNDVISFLMMIDKMREPKDFEKIIRLKEEYWEKIKEILKNENILEIVAECIESMLERINVPDEEINEMIEMLEKGKVNNMFTFAVNYDVQKVRREAQKEGLMSGIKEGIKEGIEKGKIEGIKEGIVDLLEIKFGESGMILFEKIRKIDNLQELEKIKNIIKKSITAEEVKEAVMKK